MSFYPVLSIPAVVTRRTTSLNTHMCIIWQYNDEKKTLVRKTSTERFHTIIKHIESCPSSELLRHLSELSPNDLAQNG